MHRARWVPAVAMLVATTATAASHDPLDLIALASPGALEDLTGAGLLSQSDAARLVAALDEPMDLNRVSSADLASLPQVTTALADAIVRHRAQHGAFADIEQLRAVKGMDALTLAAVEPYVAFGVSVARWGELDVFALGRRGSGRSAAQIDWGVEERPRPQGYVRLRVGDGLRWRGGLLGTYEELTPVQWDRARGQLVTPGPRVEPRIRHGYVAYDSQRLHWVAGSFEVGFGEGLTLAGSSRRAPTWVRTVDEADTSSESARVKPRASLVGLAVHASRPYDASSVFESTAFVAAQSRDLFQEDLWYSLDEAWGERDCRSAAGCPSGYQCGEDGACHSSALYDRDEPERRYQDQTVESAYREYIVGGHVGWRSEESAWLGMVGYVAHNDVVVAREAGGRFAPSAPMPQQASFGAASVYGGMRGSRGEVAGELGVSAQGGFGAVGSARLRLADDWQALLGLRAYGRDFESPHGSADAARDETLGLAARNELGGNASMSGSALSWLWVGVGSEVWCNLWKHDDSADPGEEWALAPDLEARGWARARVRSGRDLWAQLAYDAGVRGVDANESTSPATELVRQRWAVRGAMAPNGRVARMGIGVTWSEREQNAGVVSWERPRVDFDVALRLWTDGRLLLGGAVVIPPIEGATRKRVLSLACRYAQRLSGGAAWRLSYGLTRFHEVRSWRYDTYHQVSLAVHLAV